MTSRALPGPLHAANEGLAFLLELVMLAALAWWGATIGAGVAARVALGVGAPLAAAVLWGQHAVTMAGQEDEGNVPRRQGIGRFSASMATLAGAETSMSCAWAT